MDACVPHVWKKRLGQPDACEKCHVSYPDAYRGFGTAGFTTKSRKGTSEGAKRLKGALSGE